MKTHVTNSGRAVTLRVMEKTLSINITWEQLKVSLMVRGDVASDRPALAQLVKLAGHCGQWPAGLTIGDWVDTVESLAKKAKTLEDLVQRMAKLSAKA